MEWKHWKTSEEYLDDSLTAASGSGYTIFSVQQSAEYLGVSWYTIIAHRND